MKRKMPTSAELDFRLDQPCNDTAARFAGFLHGKKTDNELWGCDGAPLLLEAAILRTYSTNRHQLCVNIGGTWFELEHLPLGTLEEGALAGHIVDIGKPPQHIEHEQAQEEERQSRIEAAEARKAQGLSERDRKLAKKQAKQEAAIAARQ